MESFDFADDVEQGAIDAGEKILSEKEIGEEINKHKKMERLLGMEATRLVSAEKLVSKVELKSLLRAVIDDYSFQAAKAGEFKKIFQKRF